MSGWVQTTLPIWSLRGRTNRTICCWILTFTTQALVPAGLSGSHVLEEDFRLSEVWLLPVQVTDPQLTSENWLFPSLPKPLICLGRSMACCQPTPGSEQVWGGCQYDGGGTAVSLASLLIVMETKSNSFEIDEFTLV